jgi:hypothetical protein
VGRLRGQTPGGIAVYGGLYVGGLHAGVEGFGLLTDEVAGHEADRDTLKAGERGVHACFAARLAVELEARHHCGAVEGVANDALRAGAGVVAAEEDNVSAFEALHHREGLTLADDDLPRGSSSSRRTFRIPSWAPLTKNPLAATAGGPVDGGIHVGGQEPAEALVLGAARL